MSIPPGTRIGAYEVTGAIGAGGMGEVHRARDLTLHRDVAIKTLPELFVVDADRVARFEREAHTLAALNHPNIAQIHGLIGKAEGGPALVMELIEGEDLAERIARGPIPLDEALPIARQIADALQAAHEHGIVHRDLKPANVKVRPDGAVKVLDFGLAKAMDPGAGPGFSPGALNSPTFTSPAMTGMGMILGTAAYMSPEQARGRVVDKRADIWAFGCLVFEMITGKRAFAGDDVTETITAVIRDEPDWKLLPAGLSPSAERYLRRCFVKNPRDRVQDAGDLRLALDGAYDVPSTGGASAAAPQVRSRARTAYLAAGAIALALLAGVAGWMLRPAPAAPEVRVRRFTIPPTPATFAIANTNHDVALSPDGRAIAYFGFEAGIRQLYLRPLDVMAPTVLRRADRYFEPFISADSRWVAFNDETDFTLRKIAVSGGPPVTIATVGIEMLGATWGDDDTIVYATEAGLWRVPGGGGTPQQILKPDSARGELVLAWPAFLPGSKTVLYAARSGARFNEWTINALDLATRVTKTVVRGGTNPLYSRTGHLLYASEQSLHALPFDPAAVEARGDAAAVLDEIQVKSGGASNIAIAADGTLIYMSGGGPVARRELLWLDRANKTESLGLPPRPYTLPRIAPNGAQIALDIRDNQSDLWLWDMARRVLSRATTFAGVDTNPVWTRDSRRLVFSSGRAGPVNLFIQPADGTGEPRHMIKGTTSDNAMSVTPDGLHAIFRRDASAGSGSDLMMVRIDGTASEAVPLLAGPANEANGEVSPDGRWIAYESDESGTGEIYVRPFPNVEGGRWQVTYGGGSSPVWSPDSRQLYCIDGDSRLNSVTVAPGAAFVASRQQVLYSVPIYAGVTPRTFDVSTDGKRLLIIMPVVDANDRGPMIAVVTNWAQELKKMTEK